MFGRAKVPHVNSWSSCRNSTRSISSTFFIEIKLKTSFFCRESRETENVKLFVVIILKGDIYIYIWIAGNRQAYGDRERERKRERETGSKR